jgi:hypothetical protein
VATEDPDVLLESPGAPADNEGRIVRDSARIGGRRAGGEFPDYLSLRRNGFLREIACGPLALLAVYRHLGINLSAAEIDALLDEAGNLGIDMFRLEELAESRGLSALGASISLERLRRVSHPAIVLLNGTGFVAVTGYETDGVRVVYPLRSEGIVPDDLFERSFGRPGKALLIARSPIAPAALGLSATVPNERPSDGLPALRVSRSLLTVGRQHRFGWAAEVKVTNVGAEPLRVSVAKADCPTCTAAELDQPNLGPNQATTLRVRGQEHETGGFTYKVALTGDKPGSPVLKLPVRGYLEQPVGFDKPAVMLHELLPGQSAGAQVMLDVSPALAWDRLRVIVPDKAPLTAELRRLDGQAVLALHWQGTRVPGWYRYRLEVREADIADAIPAPFHFAAEVVPDLEAVPASVHVPGDELDTGWERRLTVKVRRASGDPVTARWADPNLEPRVSVKLHREKTGVWSVRLAPGAAPPRAALPARAELQVEAGGGLVRSVPVYFGEAAWSGLASEQ